MVVKHKGYIFVQKKPDVYRVSNDKRVVLLSASYNMLTEDQAKEVIEDYIKAVS